MSHWIKVCGRIPMKESRGSNKSKTSLKGSNDILRSKRVKVKDGFKVLNAKDPFVSEKFAAACGRAGIPITRRQLSKWKNRRGLAYKHRGGK